jgi:hypothetical protein
MKCILKLLIVLVISGCSAYNRVNEEAAILKLIYPPSEKIEGNTYVVNTKSFDNNYKFSHLVGIWNKDRVEKVEHYSKKPIVIDLLIGDVKIKENITHKMVNDEFSKNNKTIKKYIAQVIVTAKNSKIKVTDSDGKVMIDEKIPTIKYVDESSSYESRKGAEDYIKDFKKNKNKRNYNIEQLYDSDDIRALLIKKACQVFQEKINKYQYTSEQYYIPYYSGKGGEYDYSESEKFANKFNEVVKVYNALGLTDSVKTELNDCIKFWESQIELNNPSDLKAKICSENIAFYYSNISLAYLLLADFSKFKEFENKSNSYKIKPIYQDRVKIQQYENIFNKDVEGISNYRYRKIADQKRETVVFNRIIRGYFLYYGDYIAGNDIPFEYNNIKSIKHKIYHKNTLSLNTEIEYKDGVIDLIKTTNQNGKIRQFDFDVAGKNYVFKHKYGKSVVLNVNGEIAKENYKWIDIDKKRDVEKKRMKREFEKKRKKKKGLRQKKKDNQSGFVNVVEGISSGLENFSENLNQISTGIKNFTEDLNHMFSDDEYHSIKVSRDNYILMTGNVYHVKKRFWKEKRGYYGGKDLSVIKLNKNGLCERIKNKNNTLSFSSYNKNLDYQEIDVDGTKYKVKYKYDTNGRWIEKEFGDFRVEREFE